MIEINELINKYCPDGVEYIKLGSITSILRGKRLTKDQLSNDEKYAVYHGGLEPLGYYSQCNRQAGTVMIINVGASAGTVGYSAEDFWSSDGCYCVDHSDELISRYVYYALICNESILRSRVRVAGIPTLDASVIEGTIIPLPPLPVQQEIVRILDTFTELTAEITAELTAELIARKKQYEYYRNKLLTFKEKPA